MGSPRSRVSPDDSWGVQCFAPSRYRRPDCVRPSHARGTFTGSRGSGAGAFDGRRSAGPPRAPAADRPMASNTDIVRGVFDAFSRRDLAALLDLADPGIVFVPPTGRLAGRTEPYRGHEGLR